MKIRDIQRFFEELDRRIDMPVRIILTGGAAAILQGVQRATYDIDFEIQLIKAGTEAVKKLDLLQKAIAETGRVTGITPQYDEDIDQWNTIPFPTKKSQRYALIGKVDVRLLDPGLWAIGKLTRFLATDVGDLRTVLKTGKTDPQKMARLWGAALGMSPSSNMQALFRRQVESFFDRYAHEIWGLSVKPEALKRRFIETAQKTRTARIRQKPERR
jgi:hypothetical protein